MASGSKSVRISDVAAAAGVHPSVRVGILSDDDRLSVRPETRSGVLAALERATGVGNLRPRPPRPLHHWSFSKRWTTN